MIAVPGFREASQTALQGDGAIDWVLAPWTEYRRPATVGGQGGTRVWTTNDVPLLGVESQGLQALINPITSVSGGQGSNVWTGFDTNWTTGDTCSGWTDGNESAFRGRAGFTDSQFLYTGISACTNSRRIYCVEQ